MRYHIVRALDCLGVDGRKRGRSKYGQNDQSKEDLENG